MVKPDEVQPQFASGSNRTLLSGIMKCTATEQRSIGALLQSIATRYQRDYDLPLAQELHRSLLA